MGKDKTELPYTKSIINKIINEIEKYEIEQVVSLANAEFTAGSTYTKKEIIKRIKEIEF